ncbi:uncharacterized protein LOC129238353 [Anastrepha obliqua]|uniref:uncharacterized protein LOC129238353 n=1 Tax=Anastrepha obliqua TaxID=95512 RepID=UPI00240A4298|nr:uncharacterized protein LOC129238353 [Anastrepha obliqua]
MKFLQHKLSLQLQRVECRIYDESSIKSLNCSLRRDNITKEMVLDADLTLTRQINNVKCKNAIVFEHNGFTHKFHELEVDICQALSQRFDFYLFRLILDEIHRVTNFPLQCPLEKDVQYHLRSFTLNSKDFPQFLPNMKWSFYNNFSTSKKITMGFDVFGSLTRIKG